MTILCINPITINLSLYLEEDIDLAERQSLTGDTSKKQTVDEQRFCCFRFLRYAYIEAREKITFEFAYKYWKTV